MWLTTNVWRECFQQGELENQLAASQLQVFELSERVQTLQHELREGSAHEQQAPARVEDPRVPQLLAEVEALKNQKVVSGTLYFMLQHRFRKRWRTHSPRPANSCTRL